MSNKVKLAIVLSLACIAIFGVLLMRGNTGKTEGPVKQAKKADKSKSKNAKKTIGRRIIIESEENLIDDASDQKKKIFVKNDRKNYRSRTISYSDPVNDRILGDPRWAATTSQKELKAVEKAFETPPEDPDIIRFSRQRSIDVVKPLVTQCYDQLLNVEANAKGRIIIKWKATKQGRIENLEIGPNVDLRFPSFTECILKRTQNLSFENTAEDIIVEYPFAFL